MKIRLYDGIAIFLSLVVFLLFTWYGMGKGDASGYLVVKDSEGESLYSLDEDRIINVEGPIGSSTIEIIDHKAHFTHSNCKDQLCMQMGFVESSIDWAACLPNEVFIYVEKDQDNQDDKEVDAGVY